MMATTEKLLTAEEVEALPDDGRRYKLIDGERREIARMVYWHGEVESNLVIRLGRHVEAHGLGRVSCGKVLYIVCPARWKAGHDVPLHLWVENGRKLSLCCSASKPRRRG